MVLTISQESYDEAVRQNMALLELTEEEAIEETIEQFKSQGVDLNNIITDMASGKDTIISPLLMQTVDTLKCLLQKHGEPYQIISQLEIVKSECEKGLQYQVYGGKLGTYNVLMDLIEKYGNDSNVTNSCFKTLISLMTKQPDLLDDVGVETIIKYLDQNKDQETLSLVLKWTKQCCLLHERNRQSIFNAEILEHLKPLLCDASSNLLRDVLAVLRALVLDDDVRVEYGRSHEHARVIASDTLCAIMGLLEKHKTEELFVTDLLLTLSSLLVRTEFCKKVEDAGGLPLLKYSMEQFPKQEKIVKCALKVLKALAGNDECKAHIIQQGFSLTIVQALETHRQSVNTAIMALTCIAALSLRSTENSKAFYDQGAPDAIIDVMKLHKDNENVQKHASWAIRNMVSRSRYQTTRFLSLGADAILQQNLKLFPNCEYDTKAALRDLGCDVKLKEEWTGKGGKLSSQTKQ